MDSETFNPRRVPAWNLLPLLALLAGASVIACGGSEEPGEQAAAPTPAAEATETPAAEPAPAETAAPEPAATETPIAAETAAPTPPPAAASPGDFKGIKGTAKFEGERPKRKVIRMSADPGCEAIHGDTKVGTEDAIVNKDGGIANVFVYVRNGAALGAVPVPTTPAALDQVGCMYKPHVIGLRAEQPLDIINSDNVSHNIHCLATVNREFNFGQPTPGTRQQVFRKPEMAIKIKCDIHPWMAAYIFVMDHPWFAVSDESGAFSIPDLPAGNHTIVAWHEVFGEKEMQVTVPAGGGAPADFVFTP